MILSEPGPIPQAPVGQFCRHNLSPRGDGNSPMARSLPMTADTTYPREGTETAPARLQGDGCLRHTLSPRGDGHPPGASAVLCLPMTQLIPARGRKLGFAVLGSLFNGTQLIPARGRKRGSAPCSGARRRDTTYPREGTETGRGVVEGPQPERDTTYPREGTETAPSPSEHPAATDTTYPREGTETFGGGLNFFWPLTQLIPARGRKHICPAEPCRCR